jgi:hypothetical protein
MYHWLLLRDNGETAPLYANLSYKEKIKLSFPQTLFLFSLASSMSHQIFYQLLF